MAEKERKNKVKKKTTNRGKIKVGQCGVDIKEKKE